jgi:hypothetical protein
MSTISVGSLVRRLASRVFGGTVAARNPIRRKTVRLGVEALEERWCPNSTTIWTNNNGTGIWSDSKNWDNGLPSAVNDAVFSGNHNVVCEVNLNTSTQGTPKVLLEDGYTAQITVNAIDNWAIGGFSDDGFSNTLRVKYNSL